MAFEDRKYVYVVEGDTDEDKLKKLGATYVVKTGGKFIRQDVLLFLREIHQHREIVLLTDPDGPGKEIAFHVKKYIGDCIQFTAEKKKAIYHEKVGIAEMKLEDLGHLMKGCLTHDQGIHEEVLSRSDLIDLGMIGAGGKKIRMKLIEKYHMPFASGKNVLDGLNMLCLKTEDIRKEIEEDE